MNSYLYQSINKKEETTLFYNRIPIKNLKLEMTMLGKHKNHGRMT